MANCCRPGETFAHRSASAIRVIVLILSNEFENFFLMQVKRGRTSGGTRAAGHSTSDHVFRKRRAQARSEEVNTCLFPVRVCAHFFVQGTTGFWAENLCTLSNQSYSKALSSQPCSDFRPIVRKCAGSQRGARLNQGLYYDCPGLEDWIFSDPRQVSLEGLCPEL